MVIFSASQLINLELGKGLTRAFSSLLSKLGNISLYAAVIFFILSFFGLGLYFTNMIAILLVSGFILKLSSMFGWFVQARDKLKYYRRKFEKIEININSASIYTENECDAIEVKRGGRTIGLVINSDLGILINHPIRSFKFKFAKPVSLVSPFLKIKGKSESISQEILGIKDFFEDSKTYVRLPFIDVEESDFETKVKVGPIEVRESPYGEEVTIFPFIHVKEEGKKTILKIFSKDRRAIIKAGSIFIRNDVERLKIDRDGIILERGSEKIILKQNEVWLRSGDHEISLDEARAIINAPLFKLYIGDSMIKFSSNGKFLVYRNKDLADKIKQAINEELSRQIPDFLQGMPFDPIAVISTIQEFLERHGSE